MKNPSDGEDSFALDAPGSCGVEAELRERTRSLEAANARLELLARAGEILASSLAEEATLQSVANFAVPQFADWCLVDFLENGDTLRRVAVAYAEPHQMRADEYAKIALLEKKRGHTLGQRCEILRGARRGISRVAVSRQAEWVPILDEEILREWARDESHAAILRALEVKSLIAVPLCARGQVLGVQTFAACNGRAHFTAHDFAFACELGVRASLAIDNARLFREAQNARARAESARVAAAAAARTKDEFLAILSHELRTPLTVACGWLHLFRGHALDAETKNSALDAIERALASQARLVGELIETSRIAGSTLVLERVPFALVPLLEEIVAAQRESACARRIAISLRCEQNLRVRGDARRIRQIIENLLGNALKFTPDGGSIALCLETSAGFAHFVVEDSGVGISPAFLPHVFDHFRQSEDSTTRAHGGLGLGLSIARHFTELHGGKLEAFSAGEGQGARFTLSLPLCEN